MSKKYKPRKNRNKTNRVKQQVGSQPKLEFNTNIGHKIKHRICIAWAYVEVFKNFLELMHGTVAGLLADSFIHEESIVIELLHATHHFLSGFLQNNAITGCVALVGLFVWFFLEDH